MVVHTILYIICGNVRQLTRRVAGVCFHINSMYIVSVSK